MTWEELAYPLDLGEGVRARWMQSGDLVTWHRRSDAAACGTFVHLAGKNPTHELSGGDLTPTVSPNVTCKVCGHSGFIRGGRWIPL